MILNISQSVAPRPWLALQAKAKAKRAQRRYVANSDTPSNVKKSLPIKGTQQVLAEYGHTYDWSFKAKLMGKRTDEVTHRSAVTVGALGSELETQDTGQMTVATWHLTGGQDGGGPLQPSYGAPGVGGEDQVEPVLTKGFDAQKRLVKFSLT